jgi:hypothetical protein
LRHSTESFSDILVCGEFPCALFRLYFLIALGFFQQPFLIRHLSAFFIVRDVLVHLIGEPCCKP